MGPDIRHLTGDCADAYPLAQFWAGALEWAVSDEDEPGDDEVLVEPSQPGPPGLLFIRVPEAKSVKNRLHLDLQPRERSRDEEVERIVALGARVVDDRRSPTGGWVVLADLEGNEFCVEISRAEALARTGLA